MLIDLVATMAVVALLIGLVLPNLVFSTTPVRMHILLAGTASILRNARTTALAENTDAVATFDVSRRLISSGRDRIHIPADVDLSVTSGGDCRASAQSVEIIFHGNGANCGGVFRFAQGDDVYRLRVNWATGGIDVLRN